MKFLLQLMFYGLFANSVFCLLGTANKFKRHIWRGNPNSQTIGPSQNVGIKTSRSNPAALHHQLLSQDIKCAENEFWIKSHPNNCQMYISCWGGKSSTDTCSDGFLFNNVTKECDFASKVTCTKVSTQNAQLYDSRDYSFGTPNADTEVFDDFRCTNEGIFEHPKDCSKFIQCAHSGLYVQSCGPGTLFNPTLLICDWPRNVHCDKLINSNTQSQASTEDKQISNDQKGQKTRPDYDYDFDVRMGDINSQSKINGEKKLVYHSTATNNAPIQSSQRRSDDDAVYPVNSYGTIDYAKPGHRSPQPNSIASTYGSSVNQQHLTYPAESQVRSFHSTDNTAQGNNQGIITSVLPLTNQYTQQNENLVHLSPSYSNTKSFSAQQSGSQLNNFYSNPVNVETSQYNPTSSRPNTDDYGRDQFPQQNIDSQINKLDPNPINAWTAQYNPISSRPNTDYYGGDQLNQPNSDSQFHNLHSKPTNTWTSQYISTSSRPNTDDYGRDQFPQQSIGSQINKLDPNPINAWTAQYNPTSSRPNTDYYGGDQLNQPNSDSQIQTLHSNPLNTRTSQYNPTLSRSNTDEYGGDQLQQSTSNRNENVDQIMDLLDSYSNINTHRTRDRKSHVMAVKRPNSNRDHEVPIYTRPEHMQYNPNLRSRFSDDVQTEQMENIAPLSDALKLLLSPYTKSVSIEHQDLDDMTAKLMSNVESLDETTSTTPAVQVVDSINFEADTKMGKGGELVKEEPINSFNSIQSDKRPEYHRSISNPTTTSDTEIVPDFSIPTKTKNGYSHSHTNSLLNDNQSKKYSNRHNYRSYHREEIELFCKNGFDCGNGICLSSEKICDGEDNCGNRLDERNCKHIGYDVRISGDGDRRNAGRIEVKVFNKWGHICDDKFELNEANVLCREVGYPLGAVEVKANLVNLSSVGNSPNVTMFIMDDLRCTGNESSLKDCDFNGWSVHDCDAEEVVEVVCKLPDMKCPLNNYWLCDQSEECIPHTYLCDAVMDCLDGSDESDFRCNSSIQYRLGNPKSNNKEGRVEVRYRGIWGTVCDDDFGENEAKVFCRSLGYEGAAAVIKEFVKPGDGLIWLDQVSCFGNETSLEECTHFEWGENNCNHTEDVSVRCYEREAETYQKLIMRERKSGFNDLNEIQHRSQSEQQPQHCGQVRVFDDQSDYDDRPVFKVIEGREAKRGHHPWQATIRVRGRNGKSSHWCGAVLISKTHVLTAAHCLIGFDKNAYFIRLGDHHSEVPEDTEIEVFIEEWHIHEKFRKGHLMNNDIALIKLKSPVKFTDFIQPICLPSEVTEYKTGKNCSISGWGSIQHGKSTPSLQLRSAHILIMGEEICKESSNYGNSIQNGMFCAGVPDNIVDACDGDSGGPFVCQEDDENGYHTLFGIISWGQRCGDRHKPGVYTKVVEYLPWIQEKLAL